MIPFRTLLKTLRFITSHPLNAEHKLGALYRFVSWQVRSRVSRKAYVYQFTERTQLLLERGVTGATGNLYCGLMEYRDMGFLLHFLRPTDYFLDVGANVGVYSILAGGEIRARTTAVEPVPNTYQRLLRNLALNELGERVEPLQVGLGRTAGSLQMTTELDTQNHMAPPGAEAPGTLTVRVCTLDEVVGDTPPALIKIDVEGFETEVLRGAARTLASPTLKAIIIELNGAGSRYGYDEQKIHAHLIGLGFAPYTYDPLARMLHPLDTYGTHNTIYLRDVPAVAERLRTARRVLIGERRTL